MKLENIKAALKARADSLKLNPQVPSMPVVINAIAVPDKPVISKIDNPVGAVAVEANTPPKNSAGKVKSSPQIPLIMTAAQIQPVDIGSKDKTGDNVTPSIGSIFSAGDSLLPPTEETSKVPAEKPARKPATRKAKENPAPVVSAPAVSLNDIEAVVAKYLKAGRDYDRLPNTAKPTLLKSGAEILADVFGFRTTAKFINRIENYDNNSFSMKSASPSSIRTATSSSKGSAPATVANVSTSRLTLPPTLTPSSKSPKSVHTSTLS